MFAKVVSLFCFIIIAIAGNGQVVTECPENIGFETGGFNNWQCHIGFISGTGRNFPGAGPAVINVSPSSPIAGNHTLIPRGHTDPYAGFSLDAPNGSNYVIRLGNSDNGRGAEAISYTINVPANVEAYSVIFNYAVVFQNPDHRFDEQPKFTAKVIDESTGLTTECGSFEFTAPGAGGGLPGFESSSDSVMYKPWSPVMVNLSDYRGRSIRLEFTTNDCSQGRHFGYAYIDFNENCSIPILGNITCADIDSITLKTLPGLAQYEWFDATTMRTLGSGEQVTLTPVPPAGTKIGVNLTPFSGLGCSQTLYTTITQMYMQIGSPPEKCTPIDITATSLTVGNSSDLSYTYWMDNNAAVPLPDPKRISIDGTYYVKGTSSSGCSMVLPVNVTLTKISPPAIQDPAPIMFPAAINLATTFTPKPGFAYSYWSDPQGTVSVKNASRVNRSGRFYIKATNNEGCSAIAPVNITVLLPDFFIPNTFTPNGDGVNDEFTVIVSSKTSVKKFTIFNRWGRVVYETTDINRYWDGLLDNTQVPVGVYYWILEGNEESSNFRKSGYVTVLR